MGIIRSHYVGRTFIEPKQSIRDFGVKLKLNAVRSIIENKEIVVVDDSLVRGTTSKKLVRMLREAGAKKIHMRISAPPTTHSCFYGIDTPSRNELIASKYSVEAIRDFIGADSLGYLSLQGLLEVSGNQSFCHACFSGEYPTTI
jgi:amidophosphoribosyltransferase